MIRTRFLRSSSDLFPSADLGESALLHLADLVP